MVREEARQAEEDFTSGLTAKIGDRAEKYRYTMCLPHGDRVPEDKRYQLLADSFKVDFEFIQVSETDWDQKIKAWVSADNLPDITVWKVNDHLYNQYRDYVNKGIIKAIPELSDSYRNLRKIRDEMFSDDMFEVKGKLHIWLSYTDNARYGNLSDEMFFYRRDWAEKLGLEKEAYTWDEVLELARAFIAADPGGNGKGATIGMGCSGDAFPDVMGMRFISPHWDTYFFKEEEFFWGPSQPETLQAVKTAKAMYTEGLFWGEQPFANLKDAENRFVEGKLGIYWTDWSIERINDIRSKMVQVNPELDAEDIAPLVIKQADGRVYFQRRPDFWLGTIFNASLSDEKLERILQMWDWLAGEDGMKFTAMGIKGRDWDMKDGKPVLYWDRIEDGTMMDPYAGQYGKFFWNVVRLNKSFYYDYPYYPEATVKTSKEIQKYKLDMADLVDIKEPDIVTPVLDSPLLRRQSTMDADPKGQLIKILLESEDAGAEWMEWVNRQMPMVEQVLKEYKDLYKLYRNS